MDGTTTVDIDFTIPKGESLHTILTRLEKKGIISHPLLLEVYLRIKGISSLKAGEYHLNNSLTPIEIVKILEMGKVQLHRVTIPEGFNIFQIANLIAEKGLAKEKDILALSRNKTFLKSLGIKGQSIEGYLFPDTYMFSRSDPPDMMLRHMNKKFWKVFNELLKKYPPPLGLSPSDVVTLASMVEKETSSAIEKPLVASVFLNRLSRGMKLQCDPTVIYGLILTGKFNNNLTKKNMRYPSPYNTYLYKGLPPTPIACPGKDSLLAVLRPAKTSYLYFVSKNDGTHFFSSSFSKHKEAVKKYQKKR